MSPSTAPVTGEGEIHRIGGASVENLRAEPRLKPEADPPGISVIKRRLFLRNSVNVAAPSKVVYSTFSLGISARTLARQSRFQMRAADYRRWAAGLDEAARTVGSATSRGHSQCRSSAESNDPNHPICIGRSKSYRTGPSYQPGLVLPRQCICSIGREAIQHRKLCGGSGSGPYGLA